MFLECRPLPFLENSNSIGFNIAIIRSWRSQFGKIPARDFPDNRC